MRYVSIDLETTGLDPETCQVLQVAAIIEDSSVVSMLEDLPTFEALLRHNQLRGEPVALALNAGLIRRIEDLESGEVVDPKAPLIYHDPEDMWISLSAWLEARLSPKEKWVAAGKNVSGFDLQFFPKWLRRRFHYRTIDPGSVFIDFQDRVPPSLGELKKRLDLSGGVAHDAVSDARDVIRVLRCAVGR